MIDKMSDAIDRTVNVGRSKTKRVDKNEFVKAWKTFNKNITKFFEENCNDSLKDMDDDLAQFGGLEEDSAVGGLKGRDLKKEKNYLDTQIKPHLQTVIRLVEIEEHEKMKMKSAMGECVEYLIQENMIQVLCGLAKGDRPKGLLNMSLKFIGYIMRNVRSTEILNYGPNHMALHGLLQFIYTSMQNEMMILQ